MQIKITRYHFTPIRRPINKTEKQKITSAGEDVEKSEPLLVRI